MYQSEWTNKTVLHLLPHWNWKQGENIDVWAYFNNADEVELFLNGRSLGSKRKTGDDLHVAWRVPFEEGTLVPRADNLVHFDISGPGFIAGVDNGSEISHESFKGNQRKAFHGMALAIVQTKGKAGTIRLKATA